MSGLTEGISWGLHIVHIDGSQGSILPICPHYSSPEVTIVMIGKNVSNFIQDSISPVISQSHSSLCNISIVFVDDGSTDNTCEVLEALIHEHSTLGAGHLHIVRNPSSVGAAKSRNLGAMQSDPQFYVFLDSDDIIGFDYINKIVEYARSCDFGICWGTNVEFGLSHMSAQPTHSPHVPGLVHRGFLPAGPSNNMIVSSQAFHRCQGFPDLYGAPACEDTALCFNVQLSGFSSGHCADAIVHYRQRNSIMSAYRQQFNYGYGAVAVAKMFKSQGMPIQSPVVGLLKLLSSFLLLPMALIPKYRFQIIGRIGRRIGIAYGAVQLRVLTL